MVIDTRQPLAIGLLATEESQASTDEQSNYARTKNMAVLGPKRLDDSDRPVETRNEVHRIISRLREKEHQRITVDITGRKPP